MLRDPRDRYKCTQAKPSGGASGNYNMLGEENDIKNGVLNMGAAETGFTVYPDFMNYSTSRFCRAIFFLT